MNPDLLNFQAPKLDHAIVEKDRNIKDFYGYLLISQVETVEAVNSLERQFVSQKQKSDYTDQTLNYLKNKCSFLEETLNNLANSVSSFVINQDKMRLAIASQRASIFVPNKSDDYLCKIPDLKKSKSEETLLNEKEDDKRLNMRQAGHGKRDELNDESNKKDEKCGRPLQIVKLENHSCYFCNVREKCNSNKLPFKNCPKIVSTYKGLMHIEEYREIQRQFNKRVKYEVNRKFGTNFLADHQVRELDVKTMHKIKKKVLKIFAPFPLPVKAAWNNAMNSLRQDRHQLKKKKQVQ